MPAVTCTWSRSWPTASSPPPNGSPDAPQTEPLAVRPVLSSALGDDPVNPPPRSKLREQSLGDSFGWDSSLLCFVEPAEGAQDAGQVAAAGQGVGMVEAEHPRPAVQDRPVPGLCFLQPPEGLKNAGQAAPAGQGAGMIGPNEP